MTKAFLFCAALLVAASVMAQTKTPELKGWKLIWADEFDKDGLPDPKKWDYEEGFVRNQELQYYQKARKENSRIEKGSLVIEGRKERMPNPKVGKGWADWQKKRTHIDYTSAALVTWKKFSFQYGRVEVRAKMPRGKGVWPAIWMMGINRSEVGWPRCGEIDIMEYVGKDPHKIHAQNHFADPKKAKNNSLKGRAVHKSGGGGKIVIKEPWKDFHVYAIEWDEKQIKFFVDDKNYATCNTNIAGKGADNPFRKPHYLLINLALGGSWGGKMDDSVLPQKYIIDYVRIYQRPKEKAE